MGHAMGHRRKKSAILTDVDYNYAWPGEASSAGRPGPDVGGIGSAVG